MVVTAETTDLAGVLGQAHGAVLVDSITPGRPAAMDDCGAWDGTPGPAGLLAGRIAGLVAAWRGAAAYVVAVSDETGLGIVPETTAGRTFRDELGRLNQLLAAESERGHHGCRRPQRAPERLSRGLALTETPLTLR